MTGFVLMRIDSVKLILTKSELKVK